MSDTDTTLADLSEALRRFAASPRYGFVKTLQVGRLVGADGASLGAVNELTFEKLLELGTKRIAKLGWLSREQELLLVQVLDAFSESGAIESSGSSEPAPLTCSGGDCEEGLPPLRPPVGGAQRCHDEQVVSSVQLELDLRDRLQRLQRHPQQAQLARRQLGEFWDPEWLRAPFEESFTLGQLAHFDLAALFRKRMVSSDRLRCMVHALDRALSDTPESPHVATHLPVAPAVALPAPQQSLRSVACHRTAVAEWVHVARPIPPHHEALLEFFAQACRMAAESPQPLARSIARLPELISARQLLPLLQGVHGDEETYQQLQVWRSEVTVADALRVPTLILQGPAVPLTSLAAALFDGAFEGAAALLAAQLVVCALGASQPHVQGRVCQGSFSLNPELLAVLVERSLEKRPAQLGNELQKLCPALQPEVHAWLCEVVVGPPSARAPARRRRVHRRGPV